MRAYVLAAPGPLQAGRLRLEDLDDPSPGSGQVRVRVRACAACRTDLHVVEGDLPVRTPGIIPGHQVVGTIDALGPAARGLRLGQRVGVAWLHATCGKCRFCLRGAENLCEAAEFTGYTRHGGFAELILARADFVYPLPDGLSDEQAAPLLCAGIIGYRCLQRTELADFAGARLGIYGFGAAGHIAIQAYTASAASAA
jgi:propanol-preferring alcohol dehydrogenase